MAGFGTTFLFEVGSLLLDVSFICSRICGINIKRELQQSLEDDIPFSPQLEYSPLLHDGQVAMYHLTARIKQSHNHYLCAWNPLISLIIVVFSVSFI